MNWCLSCSSLWACDLGLFLVIGNRWNSSSCSHVLGVLGCSWCLVTYPAAWSMTELGFTVEKVLYAWPLLLWSTALPGMCWWLLSVLCVCAACTRPGELLGCVCVHMLGIWLVSWLRDGSARQVWSYPLPFHLVSNLPSGYATWHNLCLLCLCAGSNWWSNEHDDLQAQD
jgi:hypothetical protein